MAFVTRTFTFRFPPLSPPFRHPTGLPRGRSVSSRLNSRAVRLTHPSFPKALPRSILNFTAASWAARVTFIWLGLHVNGLINSARRQGITAGRILGGRWHKYLNLTQANQSVLRKTQYAKQALVKDSRLSAHWVLNLYFCTTVFTPGVVIPGGRMK